MITEDYVSFEIAKLLKEKGFDIPCRFNYRSMYPNSPKPFYHKSLKDFNGEEYEGLRSEWFSAPTQSLALKWLREVHGIFIDIMTYTTGSKIQFRWVGYDKGRLFSQEEGEIIYFDSYKQACETAIKYCLENLI